MTENFWLQFNNGKKEQLSETKHGVRKEQVDKKFHNLFDAYDANQDGTLEDEELSGIFKGLTKFAGADKTLDASENKQVASLFANQAGIEDADFMGFVKSVSKASEDIIDSKEEPTQDGGKKVVTTYKDGTKETIEYYLFEKKYGITKTAKEIGAKKLYISSHSSKESQIAYRKMGCVEAEEINKEILQKRIL